MDLSLNERVPWIALIRQELMPYHGRLAGTLRTTLVVVIAVVAVMLFQIPTAGPSLYIIFLLSYEAPYLTFASGVTFLVYVTLGLGSSLLLVIATDNAPIARVIGMVLFSFLTAFLSRAMRRPAFQLYGIYAMASLALWDTHLPEKEIVRLFLWFQGTAVICVLVAVAVEYAFARRDPLYALHKEFEARVQSVEDYLRAYSQEPGAPNLHLAAREIVRFSFAGQNHMTGLLEELSSRREGSDPLLLDYSVLLPQLFRLIDLTASLSLEQRVVEAPVEHRAYAVRLASACAELRENPRDPGPVLSSLEVQNEEDLLALIETALVDLRISEPPAILELDRREHTPKTTGVSFAADMWTNPEYLVYSLKISFCSALCYIIYNALDWNGISTAVITVLIIGVNTTGAISQKLIFRFVGSFIGGVIFGIGSIVFLFPHMDSLTALLLLIGAVSFIASWMARSPHFSYVGLQIAVSFFFTSIETFSAPTSLPPARDRLIGIALALVVVWVVFLEFTPARTVAEMRSLLARTLLNAAELLALPLNASHQTHQATHRLRELIPRNLISIRNLSELVPYEFSSRGDADREESGHLLEASLAAGRLFLALQSWQQQNPIPSKHRTALSHELKGWSCAIEGSMASSTPNEAIKEEAAHSDPLPPRVEAAKYQLGLRINSVLENVAPASEIG